MKKDDQKKGKKRAKCAHCKRMFYTDPRVTNHRFCGEIECRKASKKASQQKWLAKNKSYFRGLDNTERNRQWRKKQAERQIISQTPSLQQDARSPQCVANEGVAMQQDAIGEQHPDNKDVTEAVENIFCEPIQQNPLFIGLLAMVTGTMQQDMIDQTINKVISLGLDITGKSPGLKNSTQRRLHESCKKNTE